MLSVENVSKSFAGVRVLREVSFDVQPGEVLALVGENGAGKSTVLSLITGLLSPDAGTIRYDGEPVRAWSPHRARTAGIASVHQELSLNPHQTMAENVFLGAWPSRRGLVRHRDLVARARPLLAKVGLDMDPRTRVGRLSLGAQQLVELAKALTTDPRLLILDEATSALDDDQVSAVFRVVDELRARGRSVIIVSHRMGELLTVSDRLTVLKDGEVVTTRTRDRTDHEDLVRLMVGRELSDMFPAKAGGVQEPVLRVSGLSVPGACVDLDLSPGRIVGLGGLQGQGQQEVLRALAGLRRHSGQIEMDGRPCRLASRREAIRRGIGYVPEDRKTEGLHVTQSVRANLALPSLRTLAPARTLTTVSRGREAQLVADLIERMRVKASSPAQEVRRLSGGNQQKVALAKWLPTNPRVLLLAEPTRGIDVGTKREIYHLLRGLADDGMAVLVTSGDTLELVGLCDEVAVMYEGRIVDRLSGDDLTEERLVHASVTGHESPTHARGGPPISSLPTGTDNSGAEGQPLPDSPLEPERKSHSSAGGPPISSLSATTDNSGPTTGTTGTDREPGDA